MSDPMDDYYKILGVSKNASADDIRQSYIALVKKYHPDVCQGFYATDVLKKVNEAYDILSDPQKKRSYDSYLNQQSRNTPPRQAPTTDPSHYQHVPEKPKTTWWKKPIFIIGAIFGILVLSSFLFGLFSNSESSNNMETNNPPVGDQTSWVTGAELTEQQRSDIVNKTIPVANSITGPDSPIVLRGKVILFQWTPGTYNSNDYNFWVPEDLVANTNDNEMTVLLMTDQQYERVGTWVDETGKELPGYRQTTKIIGIYWPDNKPAGIAHIIGSAPKDEETVYSFGGDRPLYDWVWDRERGIGIQAIVGDEGITTWISQLPKKS